MSKCFGTRTLEIESDPGTQGVGCMHIVALYV